MQLLSGRSSLRIPVIYSPSDRPGTAQRLRASTPSIPSVKIRLLTSVRASTVQASSTVLADPQTVANLVPPTPDPAQHVQYTVALFLRVDVTRCPLKLTVASLEDANKRSREFDLSTWAASEYKKGDPLKGGTKIYGRLELPADFTPGVMILVKTPTDPQDPAREVPLFVRSMELYPEGAGPALSYSAQTFVDIVQGERYVFPAHALLPGNTPPGLQHFRTKSLESHRGTAEEATQMRKGADRVYDFDVYNDLGDPLKPDTTRPTLGYGKDKSGTLPFPRRIRTGRPLVEGYETRVPKPGLPWIPLDERFTEIKSLAFEAGSAFAMGAAASNTHEGFAMTALSLPFLAAKIAKEKFASIAEVDAIYEGLIADEGIKEASPVRPVPQAQRLGNIIRNWDTVKAGIQSFIQKNQYLSAQAKARREKALGVHVPTPSTPPEEQDNTTRTGEQNEIDINVADVVEQISGMVDTWPVPKVREERAQTWHTDEDFGRQALEGQNPLTIRAMTTADLADFAVTDADLAGLLEGRSLSERVSEGKRMWVIDFHTGFKDFVHRVNNLPGNDHVLYAGRCILYTREDAVLVPVAIELETEGVPLTVYTRSNCSPELWRLAKTIIASLDTWHHQAISHLLRTHVCVEPYIIATRRHLSVIHPIFKLLLPHFRWTMRPNADARENLISIGGTIETAFTPASFSMELVSVLYGLQWRFDEQALPVDLIKRGVAEEAEDGMVKVTLPGYSFAEDGLLVWAAIERLVDRYLPLYYDDADASKHVANDEELQAWWRCVREEGHPDKPEGWPELTDIASLKAVLSSIMWTTSAHHAAVNYGQYNYSGYMPNRPSRIRKKIPLPGSQEEQHMRSNFESVLLDTISDPQSMLTVMVMTKLLSQHSLDEEYLNTPEHSYIKDPEALAVHSKFVEELNAAQEEMERRNKTQARLRGGQGMPYTLQMPGIDTSLGDPTFLVSFRGIPTSVAI